MPETIITTIRFSKKDRREITQLMDRFGFDELAPFVRFAIRRLKDQHSKDA